MTQLINSAPASGTGAVTLAAPVTNSNRTLTLPDETGTLLTGTNPVVSQINGGQLAGMRNKIINGKMEIAQRGTSFAAIASGAYSLDRWKYETTSAAVATVTQQADAPANNEFQYSYRYAVTTADASIAAGDNALIYQTLEGYNARDLIGKTFTISFWVRSAKTGTHCIAMRNSGADRSYVLEYTVSAANTWEQKSVTVSGGLITAGTWDWTNGVGLRVFWTLASGSTTQTAAGTWQTGNFYSTANQVNCLDTIGNIFAITGVQLEVGSVATPFEHRPYGAELALCQRYYCKVTNRSLGITLNSNNLYSGVLQFPVTLRAAPTLDAGASYSVSAGSPGTPFLINGTGSATTQDACVFGNSANNWTTTVYLAVTAGLSAEL